MKNGKGRFRAVVPIRRDGEKTFWHEVGIGFANATNGELSSITIKLNSVPIWGELVLFPQNDKSTNRSGEETDTTQGPPDGNA